MIICKFGGTSVQNKEAIERVIAIVGSRLKDKPVVVVSAFSKVTRLLCQVAEEAEAKHSERASSLLSQIKERHEKVAEELLSERPELLKAALSEIRSLCEGLETFVGGVCQIGELSARSEAKIISTGELLSSVIVSAAMNAKGIKSKWVDARRMIITDDNYLGARPDMQQTSSNILRIITEEIKGEDIILTQGFIASAASGATTVLGFEGSDYSAAILGMSLGAERVEIWTDVDGIRTADPRLVEETAGIDEISYEEAAEMAYLGARVLHPLTIEPARVKNIPIRVLNSLNPSGKGSSVVRDESIPDGPKSISFRDDVDFLVIKAFRLEGVSSMLSKIFGTMRTRGLETSLVGATESAVSLTLASEQEGLEEVINELSGFAEVTRYRDKAQISIVGKNVIAKEGLIEDVKSLAGKIYMVSAGAGLMNLSFVIDADKAVDTVKGLHNICFLR